MRAKLNMRTPFGSSQTNFITDHNQNLNKNVLRYEEPVKHVPKYKPPLLNRNLEALKKRIQENKSRSRKRKQTENRPEVVDIFRKNKQSVDKESSRADNLRMMVAGCRVKPILPVADPPSQSDIEKSVKKNEKYRIKKLNSNQYLNSCGKNDSGAKQQRSVSNLKFDSEYNNVDKDNVSGIRVHNIRDMIAKADDLKPPKGADNEARIKEKSFKLKSKLMNNINDGKRIDTLVEQANVPKQSELNGIQYSFKFDNFSFLKSHKPSSLPDGDTKRLFQDFDCSVFSLGCKSVDPAGFINLLEDLETFSGDKELAILYKYLAKEHKELCFATYDQTLRADKSKSWGFCLWTQDNTQNKIDRIVIHYLDVFKKDYLGEETYAKMLLNFLDRIYIEISSSSHVHDIYFRIQHKSDPEGTLMPPNKDIIKKFKEAGWKWKMVLNQGAFRWTIMYKVVNPEMVIDLSRDCLMLNFTTLVLPNDKVLTMRLQNIYDTENLIENITNLNFKQYMELNESPKRMDCSVTDLHEDIEQLTSKSRIFDDNIKGYRCQNDQELAVKLNQIYTKKQEKDRNIKKLKFQFDKTSRINAFNFNMTLKLARAASLAYTVSEKSVNMLRFDYIAEFQEPIDDQSVYLTNTTDDHLKLVFVEYSHKYKAENLNQLLSFITERLNHVDIELNPEDKRQCLWAPQFSLSQDIGHAFDIEESGVKLFNKYQSSLHHSIKKNQVQLGVGRKDVVIKKDFMFGVLKADLELDGFVPLAFFKVTRANFSLANE